MANPVGTVLKETFMYLFMALKALRFWRQEPPIRSTVQLTRYTETRSKYVAQTTLYGYIKTRAGTRYVSLYEDPLFTKSVNIAKWEIYAACLCDLAVWVTVELGQRTATRPGEMASLACHIVDSTLQAEEIPEERPQGFDDIREAFVRRAASIDWTQVASGDGPFEGSLAALVEWAPVADELKVYDVEIVKNSMRGKWKKVRDQLREILDAEAVLADWRTPERDRPQAPAQQV